jgi:lysophospholipase L1-like esterase
MRKMTGRGAAWAIATAALAVFAGALELISRSASVAAYIAAEPADIGTSPAYAAKLLAFEAIPSPKIVIVGDSVALGEVMADHGFGDWQRHELSRALAGTMRESGSNAFVANFASNGLRPADEARLLLDVQRAGADAIVLVLGLRGFSAEFEATGERYTQEWRSRKSSLEFDRLWKTKSAVDFVVTDWLGGPLKTLLAVVRREQQAARPRNAASDAVQMLLMKRRLNNVSVDQDQRFQAHALFEALRVADARGVPVLAVYATENPRTLPQLMTPQNRDRGRAGLRALVCASGSRIRYLGPDETMTPDLFVDFIHLNPKGYSAMAERIAPELLRILSRQGADASSATDAMAVTGGRCADG